MELELNPMSFLLSLAGGIVAWVMAGLMGAGIIMKIFTSIFTVVACYFITSWGNLSNGDRKNKRRSVYQER